MILMLHGQAHMTNSDPKKRLHELVKENIVRIKNAFNNPRDPARIQVVLDTLRDVWQKNRICDSRNSL